LVQLFRVVKHNPSSFAEQMELCLHSRKIYLDLFNKKNSGDHPVHEAQRAARFFYLVRESFGHVRGRGWAFGKTNPARNWFDPDHLEAVHARLKRVYIECLDFRKLIKIWDSKDTFFYLDPPYLSASGQRFYGSLEFSEKDLKDLAAILGRISGKFLLSQPNDPEVKKLFHDFKISKTASIHYSLNQKRLTPRRRTELLIRKF
nr:DNA adenine methylase [Desulfuromonadales bacterium]NIR53205.1 DNA adenine methylase [Nitrospinaceae bacterium]NIS83600.1 DNA adenine methylase [Nitrospinaceae bacterium]NIT80390.1 DNA adenine methylase [Nitrospinaceae bacterium]NIU42733.1 DNA adenine methylase [Nitrospinaceae bacterium]